MDTEITHLCLLDGRSVSTADLHTGVERTLEKANAAGLSCAILNDGQVVYQKAFGVKDRSTGARNDEETVFAAASLGKAVFAYLVMLLAEEGVIDLDLPLYEYLARPLYEYPAYADLKGDERYKRITARMALSHSTGLPNLRFITLGVVCLLVGQDSASVSQNGQSWACQNSREGL